MPGSLGRVAQKDAPGNPARCRITCTSANTARHISPKQSRSSVSLARSCSASLLGEFASCSASLLGVFARENSLLGFVRFGRLLPTSAFVAFAHSLDDGWYRRPSRASRRSFPSVISPHPCLVRDLSGARAWVVCKAWSACFTVDQPRCAQCRAGRPPGEGCRIRGPPRVVRVHAMALRVLLGRLPWERRAEPRSQPQTRRTTHRCGAA